MEMNHGLSFFMTNSFLVSSLRTELKTSLYDKHANVIFQTDINDSVCSLIKNPTIYKVYSECFNPTVTVTQVKRWKM